MLEIIKTADDNKLTIELIGRLDTVTSPQLETEIVDGLGGVEYLALDLNKLEYVSSSGLRVLLKAQKIMNSQGKLVLKNVDPAVMEIFELTGFVDILTIE